MFEFFAGLFDTTGFVPRKDCGEWTRALMWMHVGGDLFIWLAYISIPLILLYFTRRRDLPYPRLFVLFALFILACGFGHLIEALMFQQPLYRLAGAWKVLTAVVSWVTVLALIPVIPRVMEAIAPERLPPGGRLGDTTLHRLAAPNTRDRSRDYMVALLAAVLGLLVRAAIDEIAEGDHLFVLVLLPVVLVSWRSGFGPGILTLVISLLGMIYFFVPQRREFVVVGFGNQVATAMFFFCGVCCAALGEAQYLARRATKSALSVALEQKDELAAEVRRRRTVETALREREADLIELNDKLASAQVRIAEALAQVDALVLNAPVGIALFDPKLRSVRVNKVFADVSRVPAPDHPGRTVAEVVPSFPRDLLGDFERVLATNQPILDRHVVAGPGGVNPGSVWRVSVFPVLGGDGEKLGLGLIGQDVTDRERAEQELRESEDRFRNLADSVAALIWVSGTDAQRTYFNRTWLEFTGRPVEQELGTGWTANLHPTDRDRYLGVYAEAFEARRDFELEYRLRRRDGRYRWILARGTPRFTPAGAFAGFVGLCLDVTDRRAAEEAVRANEEKFRTLAEAIPDIVWTATPDGEADYFNPQWHEYTGLTPEQARGAGWLEVIHPEDRPDAVKRWRASVTGRGVMEAEQRLRRADGAYRWFLARGLRVSSEEGAGRWVGTMTDIHDRKVQSQTLAEMVRQRTADLEAVNAVLATEIEERRQAEQQVRAVATELARSNGELEQFAYIASHDLQEPLRKIQAFGDRLTTKFRDVLPETGKEYVERMQVSAGRMRRLIDDLLTFSRVTTQAKPFVAVDLNKLVAEVVSDLSERIESAAGEVRVGPLPEVAGDPSQFRQLFQNLIANAVKFQRPGVPPVVEVTAEAVAEPLPEPDCEPVAACRITIRDNGIGFDEKYLGRIFQVFQRLHGKEEYEGTGVGLAICRKIAQRHGGTITAHSRVGEGTSFVVTLPIRPHSPGASP